MPPPAGPSRLLPLRARPSFYAAPPRSIAVTRLLTQPPTSGTDRQDLSIDLSRRSTVRAWQQLPVCRATSISGMSKTDGKRMSSCCKNRIGRCPSTHWTALNQYRHARIAEFHPTSPAHVHACDCSRKPPPLQLLRATCVGARRRGERVGDVSSVGRRRRTSHAEVAARWARDSLFEVTRTGPHAVSSDSGRVGCHVAVASRVRPLSVVRLNHAGRLVMTR